MNAFIKNIRRLMGWCPHVTSNSPEKNNLFAISSIAAPKSSGNSPALPPGWWNKRHNRMLILSSLTLFSLCWIGFQGVNFRDVVFIMGLIPGIILNSLFCIWDLRFLDKIKNSNKGVQTKNKLTTIGGILGLISLLIESSSSGWRYVLTFSLTCASGFCLTFFLYYFMLVYWEMKNNKIVLLYGSETYVVNAGKE
jgi:hypothetical protein